jgi:sugar phosphate isomerase/epimerase
MQAGPGNPEMGRRWSPWSLTSRVAELHRAGFVGIGIFHDDLAHILKYEAQGNTREQRIHWVRNLLEKNGMSHLELECLYSWMLPELDPRRRAEQPIRELLLEAARLLKARHIKIGNFGMPIPMLQLRKAFRRLCEEFHSVGTRVGMEIYMADPNAQTLDQALSWVRGAEGGGLFLDNWHVENMEGITCADIASLDAGDIVGVELSDGLLLGPSPTDYVDSVGFPSFREQASSMRRIPGEGDFDVVGFIKAVAKTGFEGPWGNEVLSEEYRRLPKEIAYPRVFRASTILLDKSLRKGRLD